MTSKQTSKQHFIEGFINLALQDAIRTLMDREDPDVDFSYTFEEQAEKSLKNYASALYDLLEKEYSLTERYSHELINSGGDLYIAAVYDYSYTFLDDAEGAELLLGNRLDIHYYVDDVEEEKIGLDFTTY